MGGLPQVRLEILAHLSEGCWHKNKRIMLDDNDLREHAMHRVAFYTRISTDEDHQKYSLDAQKDRLEAFCKSQYGDEWEMFKLYRDTESGTHMNRPGLEEMLYDASLKAFNVLLVFRVDRLSRKVRELAQMVDELTKQGIILKSITEPFDTANAAGKMMLQMLGVFAEFEHATIVERTKVGMEKKAKGGDFVGGYVPFGYRLEPDKGLVLREEESLLVKKMFSMYALGKEGSHTICLKLNEAGNRRRSGKKWDKRVIINILRNPLYIGKLRWREVVYEGNHEAIVSETLFNQTQELLDQRRDDLSGRRWNNGSRLLSGLMQCVRCRRAMVGISCHKKNAGSIPYYACTARLSTHDCEQDYVRADLLEAAVIQDIKAMFRDEGFMARVWAEANRRLDQEKPDMDKDIRRVESQMADVRARTERYLEAFETGKLDADTCNQKVRDLKARLAELEGERTELESRRERLSLPAMDREFLRRTLDDFEVVMASEENARKKHLLRRLVKKVLVHNRNTVEIWYGLPAPDPARIEGSMAPLVQPSS